MKHKSRLVLFILVLLISGNALAESTTEVHMEDIQDHLLLLFPEQIDVNSKIDISQVSATSYENVGCYLSILFHCPEESSFNYGFIYNETGHLHTAKRWIADEEILKVLSKQSQIETKTSDLEEIAFSTLVDMFSSCLLDPAQSIEAIRTTTVLDAYEDRRKIHESIGLDSIYTAKQYSRVSICFAAPCDTPICMKGQIVQAIWDSLYGTITEWIIYPVGFELSSQ